MTVKPSFAFLALSMSIFAQTQTSAPQPQRQRQPPPVVSPDVQPDGHVIFRLRAPEAKDVTLRGEWVVDGGIDVSPPVMMDRDSSGVWSVTVGPLPREVLSYYFTIDGVGVVDPVNPLVKLAAHGAAQSLVIIPGNPPRPHDIREVSTRRRSRELVSLEDLGRRGQALLCIYAAIV